MHAPTLLIVEDEERMRRLFELVLKPAGYQLLLARSGDEALRVIQEHESLDMIITDLQLGAVSGKDLEWRGMIRHGAQLVFAYGRASVPSICGNC